MQNNARNTKMLQTDYRLLAIQKCYRRTIACHLANLHDIEQLDGDGAGCNIAVGNQNRRVVEETCTLLAYIESKQCSAPLLG